MLRRLLVARVANYESAVGQEGNSGWRSIHPPGSTMLRHRATLDAMNDLTLNDYARDFAMSATRAQDIADEVAQHVADNDLDAAVLVLGVSGNKLRAVMDSAAELQRRLQDAGADWQRARDRKK